MERRGGDSRASAFGPDGCPLFRLLFSLLRPALPLYKHRGGYCSVNFSYNSSFPFPIIIIMLFFFGKPAFASSNNVGAKLSPHIVFLFKRAFQYSASDAIKNARPLLPFRARQKCTALPDCAVHMCACMHVPLCAARVMLHSTPPGIIAISPPPRRRPRTEYADTCLEKWEGRGGRATDRPLAKRTKNLRLFSSELKHVDGWDGGGGEETPATDFPSPHVLYTRRAYAGEMRHRPTNRSSPPSSTQTRVNVCVRTDERRTSCYYYHLCVRRKRRQDRSDVGGGEDRSMVPSPPSGPKGPTV